jgi:hypothetical protein
MMMNNQEIIDNAPEGATHIDGTDYLNADNNSYWNRKKSKWCSLCDLSLQDDMRSLADIKRIVELEKALNKLIDRAQQVDSWESFPESWIDEAYEALKETKT